MRYGISAVVIALVTALALVACTPGNQSGETNADDQALEAEADGVGADDPTEAEDAATTEAEDAATTEADLDVIDMATIRLQEPVAVLDPAINVAFATTQVRALTAGMLYRQDRDGVPQPELVESSEVSDDGLTVTMTLKPDLLYSDDTPLVAQDVVTMYERSILGRPGGSPFFTPFVEGVEAPDENTVVWTLLRPYAQLPLATASGELLLHPTEALESEDYFATPVSAGPYELVDFAPGDQTMRLVSNPNYVGGALMINEIEIVVVPDVTQTVLQLLNGELDFAFGMPYTFAAVEEQEEDITVLLHPTGGVFQLGLNTTMEGPLGDPTVRQAISLAIDRDEIAERAFLGVTEVNPAWVFATAPAYEPVLPDGGARDIEAAQELMDSTPFADGFELTIDTFGVRDGHNATVLLIQQQLAEIGITVVANPLEIPSALERLNENTFEAFFQGSVGPSGPSVMVVSFCPSGVWGRWMPSGNTRICDLAIEAMGEEDPSATLVEAQELAIEAMPIVPMLNRREVVGTRLPVEIFGPVQNTAFLHVATVESMAQ